MRIVKILLAIAVYVGISYVLVELFNAGTRLPFQVFFSVSMLVFFCQLSKYAWYNWDTYR